MIENVFYVYILYSKTLQKYYVGATSMEPESRLKKHLSNHKGFTGKAKDWRIIKQVELDTKKEALILEKKIKNRGTGRWLTDLESHY